MRISDWSSDVCSSDLLLAGTVPAVAQEIELHGATQFNDNHAFNKALLTFQEVTAACYGTPIKFVLHRNSELGLEKDYFNFMSKGVSVDSAIVSPSHMSTYSKMAPLMDIPFLFRAIDHWNKVLDQGGLDPIAEAVKKKRSEEHTSELQSLMRTSYAVFCLQK